MSPSGQDDEIAGDELDRILRCRPGGPLAGALIGCLYYRDDPEDLCEIVACDPSAGRLRLLRDGKTPTASLVAGYVLVNPALRAALHEAITPADREAADLRARLAAFGFRGIIPADDLAPLAAAISAAREGSVPQREERKAHLGLVEKHGDSRLVAKLAAAWIDAARPEVLPDALIALVHALRHSGRTEEALRQTDVLLVPDLRIGRADQAVLFCQRGALQADRFERTRDATALKSARKCANRSWAIAPSDECSRLYNRIGRLEDGLWD